MTENITAFSAIEWTDAGLRLLDQRRLPGEEVYLIIEDAPAAADAIREMVVRGAPAIGITAAYGVVLSVRQHHREAPDDWLSRVEDDMDLLAVARPTAVNLVTARILRPTSVWAPTEKTL